MSKIEMLKQLERSTSPPPQLQVINELRQLKESIRVLQTLPDLPEAIAKELMEQLKPLEEMQRNLDSLTAAQRASINELTTEIAVSATEAMEQVTDQLQNKMQDLDPSLSQIQSLANNLDELQNAQKEIIPAIKQMILDLEESTADLDRATRRRGRGHLLTALVTGLIFSLITILAMIAMPRIWRWLQL